MARRVFLHIGPPKTGTSFLQAAWFQHREELAEQGLLYPGEQRMAHFRAAAVLLEKTRVTERMRPQTLGLWDRLTDDIGAWDGDALLSDEHFAPASLPKARAGLDRLAEVAEEVHVMVTARDLARQVPAAWQQSVKQGNDETFEHYWRHLADHPGKGFWKFQDLPHVLDRWGQGLPPERVHLVVHGPPGAPRGRLWEQTCGLLGVDPSILRPVARANESLGSAHVELLRRVNASLPEDRNRMDYGRLTKNFFTQQILLPAGESDSFGLSPEAHAWCTERGTAMAAELRERGYDVVGDLDDLVPAPRRDGRSPEQVTDTEVADLAAAALARVLDHEVAVKPQQQRLRRENRRLRRRVEEQATPTAGSPGQRVRRLVGRLRRAV